MFWTDTGNPGSRVGARIERAAMDSSGRRAIVTAGLQSPRGISVDNPTGIGGRIYWSDSFHGTIESASLDGGERKTILCEFRVECLAEKHKYWCRFEHCVVFFCFFSSQRLVLIQRPPLWALLCLTSMSTGRTLGQVT